MLRRLPAAVLFLCFSLALDAQQLITSYSVDDGLPQSTVPALFRDNDGYLWCGTGVGLSLYDGWEFHSPKRSGEKENPSLNSPVRGIIASTDQVTMWVGTESTMMQFDRYNYRVLHSFDLLKQPAIGEVPLYANDTAVWAIVWTQGLYRVRIADGKSTRLTNTGFRDHAGMTGDGQHIVFADSTGHFVTYNIISGELKSYRLPEKLMEARLSGCEPLPGAFNEVLLYGSEGLWKANITTGEISRYLLGDAQYTDSLFDIRGFDIHPDGSWWLGIMGKGVFRFDTKSKKLRPCMWQSDGTDMSKVLLAPTCIVCDAYGVVWCGTNGAGIIKLLHSRVAFRSKFTDNVVTDTCNWFTRCFYELSSQKYLVGTFQYGLRLVDHVNNKITPVSSGPLWEGVNPLFITGSGDGRLLVGTDRSVLLLDTVSWKTEEVYLGSAGGGKFTSAITTTGGRTLICGNTGLREFSFSPSPMLSDVLVPLGGVPSSAIESPSGSIFIAVVNGGIAEIQPGGKLIRYMKFEKDIGMPANTSVRAMCIDENGELWLGTGSGLYQLDLNFQVNHRVSVENGLSDDNIYAMVQLNKNLWVVTTGHGITMFNPDENYFTYSGADGLPSEECNSGALLFSKSGLLYVGTTAGFVRWNPSQTSSCFRGADILASYVEAEPEASGIVRESIIRDYGSGSIELNIWLTDFAFPERVKYTRQLEGAETEGTSETGLRKVTYAALGSGFYSLLCSADIPGCDPVPLTKLLTIKIVPPFWMSGWFIGISSMGAILIITLILFVIMRLNYQRKIRKFKMQQELDKVRQRISRDIHDEIGAGLTRIALSGDLMSQKVGTEGVSPEKLKWIAGTARELSQSMKEVVWSVNPHYDSLDHMAAYFRSYVSGVAENADVRFRYLADENLPAEAVNPETRRNLLLILKEAVSNSVKYSGATELRLEIRWSSPKITIIISDNGKGFDLHGPAGVNSNGLRNIRQRAEASGCLVTISSSQESGTSIRLSGPIGKL